MSEPKASYGFATRCIHPAAPDPSISSRPVAPPIYQTASFSFEGADDIVPTLEDPSSGFSYSRLQNPTVDLLERAVADLASGAAAMGFASGMAAIHAVFAAHLRAGDEVVAPRAMYGGTFALLSEHFAGLGVRTHFVDSTDLAAVADAVGPKTKIVYAETIANPSLLVADLPALAEIAHRQGALFVVDSTFATPFHCRPIRFGADFVVHSASKYLGGHGDLVGGIVIGRDAAAMAKLRTSAIELGGTMAPFVAWLVLRGLKTLGLRMQRHAETAAHLAAVAAEAGLSVRYPGAPSHPQHAVAARILTGGFGGMLGLEFSTPEQAGSFLARLKLFQRGASLGDAHSLALRPASTSHRQLSAAELTTAGISHGYVRLSAGLEAPADLVADLTQAWSGLTQSDAPGPR